MSKLPKKTLNKFSALAKEVADISASLDSLSSQNIREFHQTIDSINNRHWDLMQASEVASAMKWPLNSIVASTQETLNLANGLVASNHMFKDIVDVHHSWLNHPLNIGESSLQAVAGSTMTCVAHKLGMAEQIYGSIDYDNIGMMPMEAASFIKSFEHRISNTYSSFEALRKSIADPPSLLRLPEFVLPSASREIITSGYALDTILQPEKEERQTYELELIEVVQRETSDVQVLLERVDIDLLIPYLGARQALDSGGVDRARQVLTSLRELWGHLLRKLAPDRDVKLWVPDRREKYIYDGNPTRRARVEFICREYNHDELAKFTILDTDDLVDMLNELNRLHKLKIELTDKDLKALNIKNDSWLMYILKIWEETS